MSPADEEIMFRPGRVDDYSTKYRDTWNATPKKASIKI